ncbi:hypothetical protein EDB74_102391 [Vibrio crassostreae]|nr:hypothetical protein EDB74_102391 [Vibrio crassostreae]
MIILPLELSTHDYVLCLIMFNGAYLIKSVQPLVFRGFIIEVSRNE